MSPESSTPEPLQPVATPEGTEQPARTEQLETTADAGHPAPLAAQPQGPADVPSTALSAAPSTAVAPSDPPEPSGWAARGVRMRTVVLGLVLLAVSATTLLRVLTDVHVDDSLVVLVLLVVAGVLLLGGGVASAAREARGARARR
jgi:hypothetical protein